MLTLLPPPTWAEIQAKIEDLPPPIAAFALRFLNTAHPMPDAALILADAADEAAHDSFRGAGLGLLLGYQHHYANGIIVGVEADWAWLGQ
jgi:hypothetical protein